MKLGPLSKMKFTLKDAKKVRSVDGMGPRLRKFSFVRVDVDHECMQGSAVAQLFTCSVRYNFAKSGKREALSLNQPQSGDHKCVSRCMFQAGRCMHRFMEPCNR